MLRQHQREPRTDQGTVDYSVQHQAPVVTNNEGLIIENLKAQD
jgi:hypothetical protein